MRAPPLRNRGHPAPIPLKRRFRRDRNSSISDIPGRLCAIPASFHDHRATGGIRPIAYGFVSTGGTVSPSARLFSSSTDGTAPLPAGPTPLPAPPSASALAAPPPPATAAISFRRHHRVPLIHARNMSRRNTMTRNSNMLPSTVRLRMPELPLQTHPHKLQHGSFGTKPQDRSECPSRRVGPCGHCEPQAAPVGLRRRQR